MSNQGQGVHKNSSQIELSLTPEEACVWCCVFISVSVSIATDLCCLVGDNDNLIGRVTSSPTSTSQPNIIIYPRISQASKHLHYHDIPQTSN